jgi:hypothetical protein
MDTLPLPENQMPSHAKSRSPRLNNAPAYYLGRPASWWIAAGTARRIRAMDGTRQVTGTSITKETR